MENSDVKNELKARREKFEKATKIEITPVILKGSRGSRKLVAPDLKSPDELNPKWVPDPEETIAARKAAKKSQDKSNPE